MAPPEEQVFLQLTVLLTVAVASHFAIKRFRQPTIIGEIAIGVILGPSILGFILAGWQSPPPDTVGIFNPELVGIFASLGAIFLLFLIGLEMDVRAIYQKKNILIALGGIILPWVFGFLTAFLMVPESSLLVDGTITDRFAMATFVGATLVATSTAIAAAVLLELGMIRTEVASTIMGAAIMDDILGLLVLSFALGVARGAVDVFNIAYLLVVAVAFIVLAMFIGARYFSRLVVWTQIKGLKIGLTHAGFMVAMAVAFFTSFLAEVIGLSAIIGAFVAGAMFSVTPLRDDFHEGVAFLGAVFTPIFFISLGLLVNIWTLTAELLLFGVVLTAVALATKVGGCGIPARWAGLSKAESYAVGYGMAPRGEVGLIIALAAERAGVIGPDLFSIIVLVMVVVSVVPAPLLRKYLIVMEREKEAGAPPEGEDVLAAPRVRGK
jgi:Kef-type K+ transport system membrane component KefB